MHSQESGPRGVETRPPSFFPWCLQWGLSVFQSGPTPTPPVTKQKILVIYLTYSTLLRGVIMTSYCCQQYAECLVTTLFQQDGAPAHRTAHVQQLNCCVKKRQTFLRSITCGLQTAQISVLWITRSGLSCSIVSTTDKP